MYILTPYQIKPLLYVFCIIVLKREPFVMIRILRFRLPHSRFFFAQLTSFFFRINDMCFAYAALCDPYIRS